MSVLLSSSIITNTIGQVAQGGLQALIQRVGKLPSVQLILTPLGGQPSTVIDRFLNYSFNSSILIPVDTFNFAFAAPDSKVAMNRIIKPGDIVMLQANGVTLATGLIDSTEVETDGEFGEKGSIQGRDLLAQFEDQSAVSLDMMPLWANNYTISAAINKLIENTRIRGLILRDAPTAAYLFATEPGESKLSALQRFLEPLNCVSWMNPDGRLVVGRPNMAQAPRGTLILSKEKRDSNVLSMKVVRSEALIPNIAVPIWSGQETTQNRVTPEQVLNNWAAGPDRLRKLGHRLPKTIVVSSPQASNAQGLSGVNSIQAGGSNILQAYAKREIARQNQKEVIVMCVVPGHYNDAGEPFQTDQVYNIQYDRGDVNEKMYLFQVEYKLSEEGMKSVLYFCRLGTIVSDIRVT